MVILRFLLALIMVIAPSVYAGDGHSDGGSHAHGGNSGGGGVFVELDVLAVRSFLRANCEQFESFKKDQVDCSLFIKKIDEVGALGSGLSISNKSLTLDDGKRVDAINIKPATVNIGEIGWKGAGSDVPLKIGLQAHEFLSLMGLEHTGYYQISKDLVAELRTSNRFSMLSSFAPTSLNWLRSQFTEPGLQTTKIYAGHDKKTGRDCSLFVTNKMSTTFENYYVVVGFPNERSPDDYIGVQAVEAVSERSESGISFDSTYPWGNQTKFNKLQIKMNVFGQPVSVTGTSDKREIHCVLDGRVVIEQPPPPQ